MNNKIYIIMATLILMAIPAYAGVCTITCTMTNPASGGIESEELAWFDFDFEMEATGPMPTCGSSKKMGVQYQEVTGGSWIYASPFGTNNFTINQVNDTIKQFNNPSGVICKIGRPCPWSPNLKGKSVDDGFQMRPVCSVNNEWRYGTGIEVNITNETTPPQLTLVNPSDNLQESDGIVKFQASCIDTTTGVQTISLWGDYSGEWNQEVINSSYEEGNIWNVTVNTGVANNTVVNWGFNCTDLRDNYINLNRSYTTVLNSTPLLVDLLNNNGFVDLDGNYTLACNVHTVNEVDNVQLWTNITGSWALTETMEGGFSADQGEFADVQYSHVRATDGTEYQDQIKFDGTWLSPRYTVTKAELCTRRMSASSGNLSDDDITAWRVDDQGWSSVSITTGEYNAQSKTNETISNRTEENIHGSPNWWCFDITNPVIETQAQSDTFVTIRWEDPDNAVATANALNFFTEYLWLGNTTIYENHCYNGAICGAINTPFMRVTYFDSSSSIANFTVTDTVDGEYIWNCKGMDKDSPPNNAWAPANYSYTVGVVSESDPCACPGYGENYDIPLENHCHINTTCDVGTGLVTFTGTGSYTLNATLNGTILGLDINGSTTLNVGSNGSLNLNP